MFISKDVASRIIKHFPTVSPIFLKNELMVICLVIVADDAMASYESDSSIIDVSLFTKKPVLTD